MFIFVINELWNFFLTKIRNGFLIEASSCSNLKFSFKRSFSNNEQQFKKWYFNSILVWRSRNEWIHAASVFLKKKIALRLVFIQDKFEYDFGGGNHFACRHYKGKVCDQTKVCNQRSQQGASHCKQHACTNLSLCFSYCVSIHQASYWTRYIDGGRGGGDG